MSLSLEKEDDYWGAPPVSYSFVHATFIDEIWKTIRNNLEFRTTSRKAKKNNCREIRKNPLPSVRLLQATFNPKILVFGILNPKPSSAELALLGVEDARIYQKKAKRTRKS